VPEGDTIFRAARSLHAALAGKTVTGWRSALPGFARADLTGKRVDKVEAHGKSMLIRFDDGSAVHSHMRMTGSWHIYRPAERWRKPGHLARLALETADFVAVCFSAPVVEFLPPGRVDGHEPVARLGPDLLKEDFDAGEALRRLRDRNATPLGEAIMIQRALAGIGNVYKSESLFIERLNPFLPVSAFDDATLAALIATARKLMMQNLDGPARITTRPGSMSGRGPRAWVYGRRGDPCLVCGARIDMRRQGMAARSTYFCAACQGVAEGARSGTRPA
jgi:endonuclease-8